MSAEGEGVEHGEARQERGARGRRVGLPDDAE